MTITIATLSGPFEYPPMTFGHLIKEKWLVAAVGESVPPTFLIPITDSESKDPWFTGDAPEIVFRHTGNNLTVNKAIGDGMFKCEMEIEVHLSCINQLQEFRYQKHINDLIKEWRRNPILKYSENPSPVDSGLKMFNPLGINWRTAADGDPESAQDISHTHSFGKITAIWFEHRS